METVHPSAPSERWLPLGRACRHLGVSASTLRQWADQGLIRAFRTPGGHRRFSGVDLYALLERTSKSPSPERTPQPSLSASALRRIRRRLQGEGVAAFPWYEQLGETAREHLRIYGRRLLELTEASLSQRRRRSEVLAEARLIGTEYGEELAQQDLSLREVLEAFVFFRRSLLSTVRDTARSTLLQGSDVTGAWQHVEAMADELLLAMVEAYERSKDASSVRIP